MASTPATSFSDDGFYAQFPKIRDHSPSLLPSPHQSDPDSLDSDRVNQVIEHAYQAVWDSFCGLPFQGDDNPSFLLRDQQAYHNLYERLAEHSGLLEHYESLRRNWDASTGVLTLLLMVHPLHEIPIRLLDSAIEKELERIAHENPDLRVFCTSLVNAGHSQVEKWTRRVRRKQAPDFDKSPDGQWHYGDVRSPPFIFEVAFSQEADNLDETLMRFFEELPGKVGLALGIKLDYPQITERDTATVYGARVSLLTAEPDGELLYITRLLKEEAFRNENGHAIPGEVVIPFKYLIPLERRAELPDTDAQIHVTFASLSEFIDIAQNRQRVRDKSPTPPARTTVKRVRIVDKDGDLEIERPLRKWSRSSSRISSAVTARTSQPRARTRSGVRTRPGTRSQTRSQTRQSSEPRRSGRRGSASGS